jgi:CRP/FNR family cyclic AMP-dependent transcriptional regulator
MQFSAFFSYPDQEVSVTPDPTNLLFLPNLTEEEWVTLLSYTETLRFHIGDVIINQGVIDRGLYFVVEGRLQVLALEAGGESWRQMAELSNGAIFGEQAFLDGKPRSAAVRAISDGSLSRLSPESFEKLAGREPTLAYAILFDLGRILSLRLRLMSSSNQG